MNSKFVFFVIIFLSTISQTLSAGNNCPKDSFQSGITSSGLETIVRNEDSTFNITGGTLRGDNLFHSF